MTRFAIEDHATTIWSAALVAALTFASPSLAAEERSIALPTSAPFPESVAASADGTLFVSSMTEGGVLRVAPAGSTPTVFLKPGEHDTRSTFGVLVDEKTDTLWVASNDASAIGIKGPSAVEGGWVKGFDLKSGTLKTSVRLPGAAIANDFAVGDDGALYVTNTIAPQILRLKPDANAFEIFLQDDALKGGLDGIAFGEEGALYVNTYLSGELFRIDMKVDGPGALTKLQTSRPLVHPDGLKPFKGGFLMVEGGGTLDRVTITGDKATIETIKPFAGPTGVAVAGDLIWVAEGQLAYLSDPDKKGQPLPTFQLRATPAPKE